MPNLRLRACALVSLQALAGCASSPAVPPVQPVVMCPKMPAPAAWAMEPSRSMQILQGVFSISESPSSPTPQKSPTSGSTPVRAGGLGLKGPG